MLLQDKLKTIALPVESCKVNEYSETTDNKINDADILEASTKDVPGTKIDVCLESNRRKFESEIGRDIVHERRMRKELMENLSTTGK